MFLRAKLNKQCLFSRAACGLATAEQLQ